MASSDYIVAALPGTPATAKFINAEAIKTMQSHAVFINLGRGTTVDEEALTEGKKSLRTLQNCQLPNWLRYHVMTFFVCIACQLGTSMGS